LPLDPSDVDLGEADVALKTGTASGMADLSAILVSSEFIVAAWSGRFDGQPTHGLSGMWGALPLARRVLHAALMGRRPLQVARVDTHAEPLAADSGEHSDETPDVSMTELEPWAERARARLTARIHER
jgi:membrane carboxypeptidase/penicillin-binding protein PbpC